jgi:hypothetical protein
MCNYRLVSGVSGIARLNVMIIRLCRRQMMLKGELSVYWLFVVLATLGMVVVAVVWGAAGVEAASWLAGIAGFGLAVMVALQSRRRSRGHETAEAQVSQRATATRGGRVYQAGRDLRVPPD